MRTVRDAGCPRQQPWRSTAYPRIPDGEAQTFVARLCCALAAPRRPGPGLPAGGRSDRSFAHAPVSLPLLCTHIIVSSQQLLLPRNSHFAACLTHTTGYGPTL